jgi:hypothetical protein
LLLLLVWARSTIWSSSSSRWHLLLVWRLWSPLLLRWWLVLPVLIVLRWRVRLLLHLWCAVLLHMSGCRWWAILLLTWRWAVLPVLLLLELLVRLAVLLLIWR